MARFSRRRRFSASKPVHPTKWCGMVAIDETGTPGSNQLRTICSAADLEAFTNPTIVRIRGLIRVTLVRTISNGANDRAQIHLGIRTVDEQVITAGDLATSNIAADPWMWTGSIKLSLPVESYPLFNSSGSLTGSAAFTRHVAGHSDFKWEVDVKAMRRVPQNHRLALCWTTTNPSGNTADISVFARFRTLIKE